MRTHSCGLFSLSRVRFYATIGTEPKKRRDQTPMPILPTSDEMRCIDTLASEEYGIPAAVLMENAGQTAAEIIARQTAPGRVVCLCGTGNNGADGYVVARHLVRLGFRVSVFSVGDRVRETALARLQREYYSLYAGQTVCEWDPEISLEGACIVDAVLGAGLHGEPRSPARECIESINRAQASGSTVCAIDVPSGLVTSGAGQTGQPVHATYTITFGYPKYGMHTPAGRTLCGRILCADIFFPPRPAAESCRRYWYTWDDAERIMPGRPLDAHKGRMGRVLVLAGSHDYPGAAIMAARGALASGCGLVHLAVPAGIVHRLHGLPPDVILHGLEDQGLGILLPETSAALARIRSSVDSMVIGPGLGRDPRTIQALGRLIPQAGPGCIVDADALHATLAGEYPPNSILTPHVGEFSALSGSQTVPSGMRETAATEWAAAHRVSLVVKDASTLVVTPGGRMDWITSGHPALARGGSGDVLAGLIGGFVARGLSPDDAARLGVWSHGAASWLAVESGAENLLAGDLCAAIPRILGKLAARSRVRIASEPACIHREGM